MDLVPDLSFCIVVRQGPEQLRACLQAIYDTAGHILFDVFVVDTGEHPGLIGMLERHFPAVHIFEKAGPRLWAEAGNMALGLACGRYLVLWDEDLLATPGCFYNLLNFLDDTPEVGLASPCILDAAGRPEPVVRRFPTLVRLAWPGGGRRDGALSADQDLTVSAEVDWLQGSALFMRVEMLEEIGALDEGYGYGHRFAAMDLCWRARRAGWHVHYLAQAVAERLPGTAAPLPVPTPWPVLARFFWKQWSTRPSLSY